jgi:hypothetical protein
MARVYGKRRSDPPTKVTGSRGFPRGWSTLAHPTVLKKDELAEAQNVFYTQNGVLTKRPGSKNVGEPRGNSTIIRALGGAYDIGDPPQRYLLRISDDGILQRYSFDSNSWIDIAGSPTFSDVDSQIFQAHGWVYILNSKDLMVKWNGSEWKTFTPIPNPTEAPTLTKKGEKTGPNTHYYCYVWYNEVGNTVASGSAAIASMPEVLDADTYVEIALPAAPEGAVWTGIFKGKTEGDEFYLTKVPASQTTFEDKGFDEYDPNYAPPESNTTGGFHFKFATVYTSTLIGVTTEMGDHYLVFSAGLDKFDSFGHADGGGYYAWRKDDGDPITGVHAFQEELYVFKGQKVGAFKFDENGGAVRDINLATGAVSHRSIHASGNDLRFWSREGAGSLGNEPNFANIIRTKVLSARVDTLVQSLTPSEFEHISGVSFKGLSLWGIPTGGANRGITSCLMFDSKYVAWSEWLGLTPNVWCKFIDDDNVEHLYYGDSQSGNVVECWQGTDDRGEAIVFRVATKQFDMDMPFAYKTFGKVYFIFGNVTGTGTRITLVEDGVRSQVPLALYAKTGDQGFGVDQWGTMEFGDSSGEYEPDTSGLIVRYVDMGNKDLFSLQGIVQNSGTKDVVQFAGMFIEYSPSSQPLPGEMELTKVYE